jgi:hypothetical protein
LQRHPAIHVIQEPALASIVLFGPFDDGGGLREISGLQALLDEEISIDRRAAPMQREEDRKQEEEMTG